MTDDNTQKWMEQWRSAARQLPLIRAQELRDLTEEAATRQAIALAPLHPVPLRPSSGLVEMQRWFAKWRVKLDQDV
ncbi:MAG: hypothetical protein ABGZ35_28420 [Planctomycetaceae bacterium]